MKRKESFEQTSRQEAVEYMLKHYPEARQHDINPDIEWVMTNEDEHYTVGFYDAIRKELLFGGDLV